MFLYFYILCTIIISFSLSPSLCLTMTNRAMQHSECGPVTFSRHTSPHAYYLAHAQISPSGVTGERERKKASLVDVDPLLPVTTCRRNSSDEANSRVLFPLDSVPRADSGGSLRLFALRVALSGRD